MPEIKSVTTLHEFQATPEYLACTPKMQVWLTTLIESNFDYKLATATAYNCKNLRQAHVFSYAVRKWPIIRAALNVYLGKSERDSFLEDLEQTIRRAPKGSDRQVRAQALYARMKFGVSTPDNDEPTSARDPQTVTSKPETLATSDEPIRFYVGQIITDRDEQGILHTGRVLSVDEHGKFIDVEEI
jgi:hypothetical protein